MEAGKITKADVIEVFEAVKKRLSKSSVNRIRSALNNIFTWAIDNRKAKGMIISPAKGVQIDYKKHEKKPDVLSRNEQKRFLEAARNLNHPWYPVWVMALYTGMRNGELYALKWEKVDFENDLIYIEEAYKTKERTFGPVKGRYWRQVPINNDFKTFLKEQKAKTDSSLFVLPRLPKWEKGYQAKILRMLLKEIGVKPVKFHALRGSFATELMRQNVAPATVRKICGWEDAETMEHYLDLAALEVKGATDGVRVMPEREAVGKVVDLFSN